MIFSDFDGTITEQETFSMLMREFAPEASRALTPRLLSREITLREGVPAILETIESARYDQMIARMAEAPLRPGFSEFLDFLDANGIPLIVLSGSLEDLVLARLAPYRHKIARVIAAQADSTGTFLKIRSDFTGGNELVYKPGVLKEYDDPEKIAIGDSVTDITMAEESTMVFARSLLARILKEENRPYLPFETFYDISRYLDKYLKRKGNDETG